MHPNEIRLVYPLQTITPAQTATIAQLTSQAQALGPAYDEALTQQAERQRAHFQL